MTKEQSIKISDETKIDLVNSPPHYTQASIECIDAIAAALSEDEFRDSAKAMRSSIFGVVNSKAIQLRTFVKPIGIYEG